jgi:hypothetical protein
MSCDITKGRRLPCKDQKAGVKALYFANFDNYDVVYANSVLTSLGTMSEVFKWEVKGTANTLTETANTSRDNGTTFFSQVVAANLTSLDPETQNQMKLLIWGRPLCFVEDYNGNIKLCGIESGMEATGGTIVTGGASGDLSGFTLELTGEERYPAPFLNDAAKTALLALVSNSYIGDTPSV